MKIKTHSHKQRAGILLAIIALMALAAVVYIGYKLIQRVSTMQIDPHHGNGTNAEPDITVINTISNLTALMGELHVEIPDCGVVLPSKSLAYSWWYCTQTTTNLRDWTDVDIDWDVALELVRTNHNEPMRFYRRVLFY